MNVYKLQVTELIKNNCAEVLISRRDFIGVTSEGKYCIKILCNDKSGMKFLRGV